MMVADAARSRRRPTVLLSGSASLRPEGLERALARAGYLVADADDPDAPQDPDVILVTASRADDLLAADLAQLSQRADVPRVVLLSSQDPDGPAAALAQGADDAVSGAHIGEVLARVSARIRIRQQVRDIHHAAGLNGRVFDIMREAAGAPSQEGAVEIMVRELGLAVQPAQCSFVRTEGVVGRVVAASTEPLRPDLTLDLGRYPEIREALRTGESVVVGDVTIHPLFDEVRSRWAAQRVEPPVRSVTAIPVRTGADVSGVFLLRTPAGEPDLTPAQMALVEALARAAGQVLEAGLERVERRRRQVAALLTDPLTGCATLEALLARAAEELLRAQRYGVGFCLVLLDLDGLDRINRQLGESAGDLVLAEFGNLLRREVRAPDLICRYGAAEFALLLPETDYAGARRSIERLRERISQGAIGALPREVSVTFSASIVPYPDPAVTEPSDMFRLGEAALRNARRQGS